MLIRWTKRPTYEEFLRDLEKGDKVKLPVLVISVDIAISTEQGNLMDPKQVAFWRDQVRALKVVALVLGPPCETWSHARRHQVHIANDLLRFALVVCAAAAPSVSTKEP